MKTKKIITDEIIELTFDDFEQKWKPVKGIRTMVGEFTIPCMMEGEFEIIEVGFDGKIPHALIDLLHFGHNCTRRLMVIALEFLKKETLKITSKPGDILRIFSHGTEEYDIKKLRLKIKKTKELLTKPEEDMEWETLIYTNIPTAYLTKEEIEKHEINFPRGYRMKITDLHHIKNVDGKTVEELKNKKYYPGAIIKFEIDEKHSNWYIVSKVQKYKQSWWRKEIS